MTTAIIRPRPNFTALTSRLLVCLTSLAFFACSDSNDTQEDSLNEPTGEDAPLLPPPPAGRGTQLTMTTSIETGNEVESCRFVRSGDETLFVNHDEIRFTSGSHHVLVFTTSYDEIPAENDLGEEVDTGGVFDCTEGVQGFWSVTGLIAASQSADGDSSISYPEGVGVRVPADTLLLMNAHYINSTSDVLEPEIFVNLHSIPEDELEEEGGLIFWYNPFLKVPANGESAMRASCPVSDDIQITNAQSHMHKHGVGYVAELVQPGEEKSTIYTGNAWEDVPVDHFDPNLEVSAGSRIEWECAYENLDSQAVYQGPKTTDEMCMLIGSYYPRNDDIGFCVRNGSPFLGAEWMIGAGSANCAESLQCIIEASTQATVTATGTRGQETTSRITECLIASDSSVSAPLSDVLGCLGSTDAENPLEGCATEVSACQAI